MYWRLRRIAASQRKLVLVIICMGGLETTRTKLNDYKELWIDGYGQTEAANREFQGMILDTVFVNFAGISAQQLKLIFLKIKKQNGCLTNLVLIDKTLTKF